MYVCGKVLDLINEWFGTIGRMMDKRIVGQKGSWQPLNSPNLGKHLENLLWTNGHSKICYEEGHSTFRHIKPVPNGYHTILH